MKIAITYSNGEVFQHYGKTEQFKIYEVEGDKIVYSEILSVANNEYESFAELLSSLGVKKVICGGIGAGAIASLKSANIKLYGGVSGNADREIENYLTGNLKFNPNIECDHHKYDNKNDHKH